MGKYKKKPVVIEAVQLTWENWSEICDHAGVDPNGNQPNGVYVDAEGNTHDHPPDDGAKLGLSIPTLEGTMLAVEGDWVIKGVQGEIYPCKPDIFAATYEPA